MLKAIVKRSGCLQLKHHMMASGKVTVTGAAKISLMQFMIEATDSPDPGFGTTLRSRKRNGGMTTAAPPRIVATLTTAALRRPPGLKASL